MKRLDLTGAWSLRADGQKRILPATVPGCVHTDLMDAHEIEDPFYRDNETRVRWVGESDWIYERTFIVDDLLRQPRVLLRCEGLDTLAVLSINGIEVGRADNMFRVWEFDVGGVLKRGANRIQVRFESPVRWIAKRSAERPMPGWGSSHEYRHRGWIRKEPCNFGWDWGPVLVTSGIWRAIGLVAFDTARLTDAQVRQEHAPDGSVALVIAVTAETLENADLCAHIKVAYKGGAVACARVPLAGGVAAARLNIQNPQRWWPNGMGDQPLYEVTVELRQDRRLLDQSTRRIGLRTLRLDRHADAWGESFQFVVNGVPFFAKGANWIPADAFVTRLTRVEYARLIKSAAVANMNMLRCWGGGIYENDAFYDLCDEYGLCVWQDFMFACSAYPAFDADWMANVRVEAEQNIRRLRHHPCIALWCGNNELEQGLVGEVWDDRRMSWTDYASLFDKLLPDAVHALDPDRDYWPCSPHTPPPGERKNFNDPTRGDAHLWDVWHGRKPFEWYRTSEHRFCSEFGFQSFPEPRMVKSFTAPEDRNVTAFVMEHHQRSGTGNALIVQQMLDWYRMPVGFENTLWLSQIQQGISIKYAVEHWRRNRPHCMGALYWQLNDCWPVASWASVDYGGRWKALHYLARRFYAPVLISGVENPEDGTVAVHLGNDLLRPFKGEIQWRVTRVDGSLLREGSKRVRADANSSAMQVTVDAGDLLKTFGARDLLVWLTAVDESGAQVSWNLVAFCRPKHLELPDPRIGVEIRPWDDNSYAVTLTARHPALWVWLSLDGMDAKYDDNFICLEPDRPARLRVTPATRVKADAFRAMLRVSSLRDTYQEQHPALPAVQPAAKPVDAHAMPVRAKTATRIPAKAAPRRKRA